MKSIKNLLVAAALAIPMSASAIDPSHPGFVDLDALGSFAEEDVMVDIRLGGWLLDLARVAAEEDEDVRILSQIESVRVRVLRGHGSDQFRHQANQLVGELRGAGWEEFATVRDEDDRVHVLVNGSANHIDGITVIAWDADDETVLINVAGKIRPEDIARIISDDNLIHTDLDLDFDA